MISKRAAKENVGPNALISGNKIDASRFFFFAGVIVTVADFLDFVNAALPTGSVLLSKIHNWNY